MAEKITLKMKDNSPEFLAAMKDQVELALKTIGTQAVDYAQDECPVDTGRLKNSINYATNSGSGWGGDSPLGTPEPNTVCVGSNVEYAERVELTDRMRHTVGKAHFIRDSLSNHGDHYKAILEAALRE